MRGENFVDIPLMHDIYDSSSRTTDTREALMEPDNLLVIGVGGLGCNWARGAHTRVSTESDLLLVDADINSFLGASHAHCMHLDPSGTERGSAALPSLAGHRTVEGLEDVESVIEASELVIILTGLGGGTGTGSSVELAKAAKRSGSLVVVVAGLPFAEQTFRTRMAMDALPVLESVSDVCIRVSLERLAWHARTRRMKWSEGSGWIEELVEGLVSTIGKLGKINLDMMDLKSVIRHEGRATLIVASGPVDDIGKIADEARRSPLIDISLDNARGCLIQVEGGPDMTLTHIASITEDFTQRFNEGCQVILGARVSDRLIGRLRIIAVVSGLD